MTYATPTKVFLRWDDATKSTLYVKRKGRQPHIIDFDLLDSGLGLPDGAAVRARVTSGPKLISCLVRQLESGKISKLVISSFDRGSDTIVGAVDVATVKLWDVSSAANVVHPVAATLLPYVPGCSAKHLSILFGLIFDPRWFFDHTNPDSYGFLESHLGLVPRFDTGENVRRHVVTACWSGSNNVGKVLAANDFYNRMAMNLFALGYEQEAVFRKVGRRFVRALVAAWLDAYTAAKRPGYCGDAMFCPAILFDREAVEAVRGSSDAGNDNSSAE